MQIKNNKEFLNKKNIDDQAENLSELLVRTRQAKKASLEKVATELKINQKYLMALENGAWHKLPSGLYGKNYLKEYALFLQLDVDYILALYDQEVGLLDTGKNYFFGHRVVKNKTTMSVNRISRIVIASLIVLVCLGYLLFYLKNISAAPKLEILSPTENIYTKENSIVVRGQVEVDAEVWINEELVLVNHNGVFEKKVNLSKGKNTIFITAKKKHGKEAAVTRYVIVDN